MKAQLIVIIQSIPDQKVVSYGQLAEQLCIQYDIDTSGRVVGRTLSAMSITEQSNVDRRKVVNRKGIISSLKLGERWLLQIQFLQQNNIIVINSIVDMSCYQYHFSKTINIL